jgi:addiction module HigA family antidote
MLPKHRAPTTPGEILLEEFLKPTRMTQTTLAAKMGVPIQRVNTLINGKRGVTAETALLLAKVFGTTPQFWMNLQVAVDLWYAQQKMQKAI